MKLTAEQYNELDNRLDSIKQAIGELQSALYGLDSMDGDLDGKLLKAFGVDTFAATLDDALYDLVEDINANTEEEFSADY